MTDELAVASATNFVAHGQHFLDVVNQVAGENHYLAGQITEAAWWWQYSYFSDWADRAVVALRVVQRFLIHARLDIPADVVQEAQFEALHSEILNLD